MKQSKIKDPKGKSVEGWWTVPDGEAPLLNDGVSAQTPVMGGADEKTSPLGGETTSDQPTLSPEEIAPTPGGENTAPNELMEKEASPKSGESERILGESEPSEPLTTTIPGGDEVKTPNAGADAATPGEELTFTQS